MRIIQSRLIVQLSAIVLLSLIPLGCSPSITDNAPESAPSKTEKSIAKTESTKRDESVAAIDEATDKTPVIKEADNTDIKDLPHENGQSKSPASSGQKFADGDYRDGYDYNESGLEIEGAQYRHTSEMGVQEWRSIRQLKFVTDGVVLDEEEHYWCLSSLIPPNQDRSQRVVCSQDGWVRPRTNTSQANLPFIGQKRFNFMGGSGTGQTITIEPNGHTIVQLHGTQSSSIQFSGKFSDLEREMGLQIQGDTILNIEAKGDICSSNDPDRAPCKTNLY